MNLLILAAGFGGRLSPETDNVPKCLLKISPTVTILDHQLSLALLFGFRKITIVAGFMIQKIEDHLKGYDGQFESIKVIYNPFYRTTNNLVSLWFGLNSISGDFVMMNGDSILSPDIFGKCLENDGECIVPISKKSSYDSDDTKISLNDDNSIVEIGKFIKEADIDAEWMGVAFFRKGLCHKFRALTNELIRQPQLLNEYPHYLSVIQGMIDQGEKLCTIEFSRHAWAEVDFKADLDEVRAHVDRYLIRKT